MVSNFNGIGPLVSKSAWIAPTASVIGEVSLGENTSVWFACTLRGDRAPIFIGSSVNVQDGAVIHADHHPGVRIGNRVSIGHGAIVHGCQIDDDVLIGMGAIVMDDVD